MALNKEDIYELLEKENISYSKKEHPAVYTMDDMVKEGLLDEGVLCKNLFLRDQRGKNHFLVTTVGDKKINLKELAKRVDSKPFSFASEERLDKYLHLKKGSVSPLGLLNDDSNTVTFILDTDLKGEDLGIHPNDNTATIWITYDELKDLVQKHGSPIVELEI